MENQPRTTPAPIDVREIGQRNIEAIWREADMENNLIASVRGGVEITLDKMPAGQAKLIGSDN